MSHPSREKRVRAIAVAVAAPLILAAAFGFLFWAKAVRTVANVDSPDGAWTATVRVIHPGGSGSYSTHVVVSPRHSWLPSRRAKAFVADDAQGAVSLGSSGELPLALHWGEGYLLISYPAGARVYRQETQVGTLRIAYEAK